MLDQRQGIHIRPQGDHFVGGIGLAAHDADHTCFTHTGVHLVDATQHHGLFDTP